MLPKKMDDFPLFKTSLIMKEGSTQKSFTKYHLPVSVPKTDSENQKARRFLEKQVHQNTIEEDHHYPILCLFSGTVHILNECLENKAKLGINLFTCI